MYRRTVLAAATATLAGCGLSPSPPTTDGYPETPPNAFFAFEWNPDDDEYVVEFARGNRLTADNTGALAVVVDPVDDGDPVERLWVGAPDADPGGGDFGEPLTAFPLAPDAQLRVPVDSPGTVRVVWTDPEAERSRAVGRWRIESQPTPASEPETETATATKTATETKTATTTATAAEER
ncbi:hypothetical protein [Halobaculum magnesiiphilum]|uniref:Lipoprotein n=1 Tax=Halobaculum magnesiiphilum TaxID=1017351 RepID=A0A8T8WFK8_9EURY|nr:hypothetical protein [Halobaculum magnesiiphilum]QZP38620.1 hypothetical protein K6T50_05630 [Halobaculum magnesiiphilum]